MIDYLYCAQDMVKICEEFKEEILKTFFEDKSMLEPQYTYFCYTPRYRRNFEKIKNTIEMCDLLGIKFLEKNKDYLSTQVKLLEDPNFIKFKDLFTRHVDAIRDVFKDAKVEIKREISKLDKVEKERLNEAVHTFFEECYYSTVAMSVSAVERRLLKLMIKAKPKKKGELEKLTLGQLVWEYLRNKDEYKRIVPERHENLLHLCNRYRISAVHPKGEEITKRVASSILNLTFEFLLEKH